MQFGVAEKAERRLPMGSHPVGGRVGPCSRHSRLCGARGNSWHRGTPSMRVRKPSCKPSLFETVTPVSVDSP
jgi:hypothetical protein